MATPNRPTGSRPPSNRPAANRPASNRPATNRPSSTPPSRTGASGMANRRDVTDNGVKSEYFKRTNFDETKKSYTMVKITFASLAVILLFAATTWFFGLGTNCYIIAGILFVLWMIYFVNGLRMRHKFRSMPLKERSNYWTYELSQEYTDVNVKMNDFKRALAQSPMIDDTVLIDDVNVEMLSMDPLVFEFSIRSTKTSNEKTVLSTVEGWAGKFEAREGHAERIDNITYRVTYPMQGQWQILDGKTVTPDMALSTRTKDVGIDWNPFGVKTTTMEEVAVVNSDSHIMITGISGYGKSATLNSILKNIMEDPNDPCIIFFDRKYVEAAAIQDRCWSVITEEQALVWAEALDIEIKRRQKEQSLQGKKKFATAEKAKHDPDAMPFSNLWPPIVVVVDECAQWLTGDYKFTQAFSAMLATISRLGRSNGVTLIVASQEAKGTTIPNEVRTNIDQRIAFKLPGPAEDEHAIGNFKGNDPKPSEIPNKTASGGGGCGQCCARTSSTNGEVWPVKGYFVSSNELRQIAQYTAYKKKRYKLTQWAEKEYNARYAGKTEQSFQ